MNESNSRKASTDASITMDASKNKDARNRKAIHAELLATAGDACNSRNSMDASNRRYTSNRR